MSIKEPVEPKSFITSESGTFEAASLLSLKHPYCYDESQIVGVSCVRLPEGEQASSSISKAYFESTSQRIDTTITDCMPLLLLEEGVLIYN